MNMGATRGGSPASIKEGAAKTAMMMYAAVVGMPQPKIMQAIIVNTRPSKRFVLANSVINELNFTPIPVRLMIPMMIPALAQADATGMVFRAAVINAFGMVSGPGRVDFPRKERAISTRRLRKTARIGE